MTKVNVWFNRTFGTTYHLIQELKSRSLPYQFYFFGTHPNLQSVFLQVCDVVEKEPLLSDEEYVHYALDFCKRNHIDIFLPGEFSAAIIAANKSLFESIGVKIGIAFSEQYADVLSSKARTYESLRSVIPEYIPEFYLIHDADEFSSAHIKLNRENNLTCFKPDKGFGGLGFRIVDDTMNEFRSLMSYPSPRNTYGYYYRILQQEKKFSSLIMMQYLKGTEISVDCLAASGLIMFSVAKEKKGTFRIVKHIPFLQDVCNLICNALSLDYLFNIQFRYGNDERLYLLDLNTRPSGGLYYSYKAGYSMMTAALNLLLNGEKPHFAVQEEKTFIELEGSIDYKLYLNE